MTNITTISLKQETKERLENIGRKSQSYDDLINELVDMRIARDTLKEAD